MTAAKTGTAVITGQTSLAGSTYASPSTGCQSAAQNQSANYGCVWTGRMTPGSGVTTGAAANIDVSSDGTNWRLFTVVSSGTAANNFDFAFEIPAPVLYTRITFFGNTGGSVTVSAELHALTAV